MRAALPTSTVPPSAPASRVYAALTDLLLTLYAADPSPEQRADTLRIHPDDEAALLAALPGAGGHSAYVDRTAQLLQPATKVPPRLLSVYDPVTGTPLKVYRARFIPRGTMIVSHGARRLGFVHGVR